ncbi:MAG TPA: CmcI family methyltransferase [Verrucomicrobiota bacterium]|nr:CmcI family methyltransferase [Verrucomicrobiota bacterium]HNU51794.1 CmcI family methyltransferase [Verrucomicrobiota bacterium]
MKIRQYLELQYFLLLRLFARRPAVAPSTGSLADEFLKEYYSQGSGGGTWYDTRWLGARVLKCPFDLWVYQEILFETQPSLIVETGTFEGGGALFLASICDLIGKGKVITIDAKERSGRPAHPRITYWTGSSVDPAMVARARERAAGESVMVILDSDHRKDHVSQELAVWSPLVTEGNYLIVEDTSLNGHPVVPEHGPGPMEAVAEFVNRTTDFEVDRSREKFLISFNPRGYLRRVCGTGRSGFGRTEEEGKAS